MGKYKVKYHKDMFRLMETLTGVPISCETCKYWSTPANNICKEMTYYEHVSKKGEFKLLAFCERYKRDTNGYK